VEKTSTEPSDCDSLFLRGPTEVYYIIKVALIYWHTLVTGFNGRTKQRMINYSYSVTSPHISLSLGVLVTVLPHPLHIDAFTYTTLIIDTELTQHSRAHVYQT
jgi:hypothetical protein